jgi:hypothetical protein
MSAVRLPARLVVAWGAASMIVAIAAADEPPPDDEACWELLETVEQRQQDVQADPVVPSPDEEAARLEAQEIAAIAEEILAEGDCPTAALLLEEALALLGGVPPES